MNDLGQVGSQAALAPKKQPVSLDILDNLGRLHKRAEGVSITLSDKLMPVMGQEPSHEDYVSEKGPERPPLFADMDKLITQINDVLRCIEDNLGRVEL